MDPEFRGRGIARAITSRLVSEASVAGFALVWLTPANRRTQRIYACAGFSVRSEMLHIALVDESSACWPRRGSWLRTHGGAGGVAGSRNRPPKQDRPRHGHVRLLSSVTLLPEASEPVRPLTAREGEVVQVLVEGLTNRAIAHRFGISSHTAARHKGRPLGGARRPTLKSCEHAGSAVAEPIEDRGGFPRGRKRCLALPLKSLSDVLHEEDKVEIIGWTGLELGHQVQVEVPGLG